MLLNAAPHNQENLESQFILLAFEDVTNRMITAKRGRSKEGIIMKKGVITKSGNTRQDKDHALRRARRTEDRR